MKQVHRRRMQKPCEALEIKSELRIDGFIEQFADHLFDGGWGCLKSVGQEKSAGERREKRAAIHGGHARLEQGTPSSVQSNILSWAFGPTSAKRWRDFA